MAQRYYSFNTLAKCFRDYTGIIEDTTAGRFDSNFVSNYINIPYSQDVHFVQTYPFEGGVSSVTTLYHHMDFYFQSGNGNGGSVLQFLDSSGQIVAILNSNGSPFMWVQFMYWNGSAFVNHGPQFSVTQGRYTFDAKVVCGSGGSLNLWSAGMPAIVDPGGGLNAAVDNIAAVRIFGPGGSGCGPSQVMGADYDLRDAKLLCQLANGNGADTDGSGDFTKINEVQLDDSTAVLLPVSGDRKTFTHAPITVPQGYGIASVAVGPRGRVSGGVITDGKALIRSGGDDYLSPALAYNTGYEPRGAHWDLDPATGLPWTLTGYNAAEFCLAAQ